MKRHHSIFIILILPVFALVAPVLAQEQPPARVVVAEARQGEVHQTITFPATVESQLEARVASEISGRVDELMAREGERVEEDQALAKLDDDILDIELEGTKASLKEAEASLALARWQRARAEDLLAKGVISENEVEERRAEVKVWEARMDQRKAQVARLEEDLRKTTIRAPFNGIVTQEHTEVGEWVEEGNAVVSLTHLEKLRVWVEMPERYFPQLREGDSATVSFDALPDVEVGGRVIARIPQAHLGARTFPVKVEIPNPDGQIGVGMMARVSLLVGGVRDALLVPKDAVVGNAEQFHVYIVEDGRVRQATVVLGLPRGDWVEVTGQLESGDRVVVRGNERLFAGQPVAISQEIEIPYNGTTP